MVHYNISFHFYLMGGEIEYLTKDLQLTTARRGYGRESTTPGSSMRDAYVEEVN
jgi:hypothetical protein